MHDAVPGLADLQHGQAEVTRLLPQVCDEWVGKAARIVARRICGDRVIGNPEHKLGSREPDPPAAQLRKRA